MRSGARYLDHELMHATVAVDDDGEPKRDTKDRVVYRTRKHDIEEFSEIVRRHGCYKRDLEEFAAALRASKQGTLPLDGGPDTASTPGEVPPEESVERAKERMADAVRRVAPAVGSGIERVTVTFNGESVELTQEDRARMDAARGNGNGKGPLARARSRTHRTPGAQRARARGKAARP